MQLTPPLTPGSSAPNGPSRLGARLRQAACVLLAAGAPAARAATADGLPAAAQETRTRYDLGGLFYAEAQRTSVAEPLARITRLFPDGQSLSVQFALDVMTGSSPTGANPAGVAHTTTSASGTKTTVGAGEVPVSTFKDMRGALDLEYERPLGHWTPAFSTHFSREKDYQSLGGSAKLSVDVDQRRSTLTFGGGLNRDRVFPVGGLRPGLTSGRRAYADAGSKNVRTALVGTSRVLSRRWLGAVNVSRTWEDGYLTEPYKVVSLISPTTGRTTGELDEKRPDRRLRTSVLVNSNYHLTQDVLYVLYRYYWDDWAIRSHTFDLRYRFQRPGEGWLEPHARYYTQGAADFFRAGLRQGSALPAFASADRRLGEVRTATLGLAYGFRLPGTPGEWSVRGEYMGQFGNSHPKDAIGVQRNYDQAPPLHVGSIVFGWTIER